MSVSLKQFAGSTVTPSDDANLYHLLYGRSGIVTGIEATHAGTNQLAISAGWGVVYGRVFTVEAQNIGVTLTGGAAGRLKIVIDISAETPAYFESEAAATLPALVQEDLSASGNEYELSICTYDVGAIAISNIFDARPILPSTAFLPITGGTFTGGITAPSFSQTPDSYGVSPLEIGKYIDFHDVGSTADCDSRYQLIDGFLEIYNPLGATTGKSQHGRILTRPALIDGIGTNFTLDISHAAGRILCGNNTPTDITITIPAFADVAYPVGTSIDILRWGSGEVAITAAGGVYLASLADYRRILAQFGAVSLVCVAEDAWLLMGALKA